MTEKILDGVNSVADLKALPEDKLAPLADEIRGFLIEKVEACGGHLASNLGVIELTLAIHRVFDSPNDHIIFDVGHQAYVHKMLTGRKERFDSLRAPGGLSGFTSIKESEHDSFGAGHSSTSVSAALGFAEADKIKGKSAHTVCVIGDGAYTGGMVHEALNNCKTDLPLIIILNENGMSISNNKGTFASYLSGVRISQKYVNFKKSTNSFLEKIPLVGKVLKKLLSFVKDGLKNLVYSSNYFEDLGLYYLGPIDGHNYKKLEKALTEAKRLGKCVVVHVKTMKGKGYEPAERSPDEYHSVACSCRKETSFHEVAADELLRLAESDPDIVTVTAAMGLGTGLDKFGERHPDKYFDVGIAEEHALTFSAGLAADGLKPFVGIYSTFLQRGYDNIIHDIALQSLPVKILIDRAGIAARDGATHHGIFDVAFLSHIPGMTLLAPATYGSLRAAIGYANRLSSPVAIRYPNSAEDKRISEIFYPSGDFCGFGVRCDFSEDSVPENIFITYGSITSLVLDAKELLEKRGERCGVILVERLKPYEGVAKTIFSLIKGAMRVLYVEEGVKNGGAAMITRDILYEMGIAECGASFDTVAIDDSFVIPDSVCDIYDYAGFRPERLAEKMLEK